MLPLVEYEPSAWFGANCETEAEMIPEEVGCKWNGEVLTDLLELPQPPGLKAKGLHLAFLTFIWIPPQSLQMKSVSANTSKLR